MDSSVDKTLFKDWWRKENSCSDEIKEKIHSIFNYYFIFFLSPLERTIMIEHYFDGMTLKDIASTHRMSLSSIYFAHSNAIRKLREKLVCDKQFLEIAKRCGFSLERVSEESKVYDKVFRVDQKNVRRNI